MEYVEAISQKRLATKAMKSILSVERPKAVRGARCLPMYCNARSSDGKPQMACAMVWQPFALWPVVGMEGFYRNRPGVGKGSGFSPEYETKCLTIYKQFQVEKPENLRN
jgi:hypothetical protein